jgi:hypothetical protein
VRYACGQLVNALIEYGPPQGKGGKVISNRVVYVWNSHDILGYDGGGNRVITCENRVFTPFLVG